MNRVRNVRGRAMWAASLLVGLTCGPSRAEMQKVFALDGNRAVPPTVSHATGAATMVLRGRQAIVRVRWEGLSGRPTRFEIHGPALPGQRAGTMFVLPSPRRVLGPSDSLEASFTVPQSRKKVFRDELAYLVVRTGSYPHGEIRGQIVPTEEEVDEDE